MPDRPQPPAVLLGGGLGALCAARTLGRSGVEVHLLGDAEGDNQAAASRFVRSHLPAVDPDGVDEGWLHWLEAHRNGSVLLPCSDAGLEFLATHGSALGHAGFRPVELQPDSTRMALDKASSYRVAADAGLHVPLAEVADTLDDVRAAAARCGYPCALKPRFGHQYRKRFTGKAVVARSLDELEQAFVEISAAGIATLVTEIVPGPDRFCSYYTYLDPNGLPLTEFTKLKVRQWPVGFGMGCDHLSAHVPEAADLGLRFAQSGGLRGMVNVEFKRDERDGCLVMIECNPRITAATELVRRAGIDFVRLAYARAAGQEYDVATDFADGVHQWHLLADARAFAAYRQLGDQTTLEWARSLAHLHTYVPPFDVGDMGPAALRLRSLLTSARRRATSRGAASAPAARTDAAAALGRAEQVVQQHRGTSSWGTGALLRAADLKPLRTLVPRLQLIGAAGPVTTFAHSRRGRAFPAAQLDRQVYRTIWEQAAAALGAEAAPLGDFLEIRRGRARTLVSRQMVMMDDVVTQRLSLDKTLVQRLLREAGVTVPDGIVVNRRQWRDGAGFLGRHAPCVVKPAAGTGGGQGVTGGVCTTDELARAVVATAPFGDSVLIERQVQGGEHRVLVLNGECIDCLLRRPPAVVGDGRSSVSELVHAENVRRAAAQGRDGLWPIRLDLDLVLALRRQGLGPRSVPALGQRLTVKSTANESGASDCEPVEVPPDVAAAALAAARAVGTRLASVEVIRTTDGTAAVIDVNSMPGLHYHYQAMRRAAPVDAAQMILRSLLDASNDRRRSTA